MIAVGAVVLEIDAGLGAVVLAQAVRLRRIAVTVQVDGGVDTFVNSAILVNFHLK